MSAKYTRNITDKVNLKGVLDDEAKTLTYEDKELGTVVINVQDYIDQFASQPVDITIKSVSEEILELPDPDDEETEAEDVEEYDE